MPLHQNQDGTWQWGKSGKKYKKKEDAIKQMKAIFASGYVEKHASLNDSLFTDINYKGNSYMTYTDVCNKLKKMAKQLPEAAAFHPGNTPVFTNDGGRVQPRTYLAQPIGKFRRRPDGTREYKRPGSTEWVPFTDKDMATVIANTKKLGEVKGIGDFSLFPNYGV